MSVQLTNQYGEDMQMIRKTRDTKPSRQGISQSDMNAENVYLIASDLDFCIIQLKMSLHIVTFTSYPKVIYKREREREKDR